MEIPWRNTQLTNNNNVDAKEEEDNNMDVLCVQTFHNDKFWREC